VVTLVVAFVLALVVHSLHAHRLRGIKRALTGVVRQDALLREYIFVIMSGVTGSSARKRPRSLSADDDIRWMMSEAELADRHNWASMSACYFEKHLVDAIVNGTYHMTLRARRSV
jgi:hypothetical protein